MTDVDPAVLADDVQDLRAQQTALAAQLEEAVSKVNGLTAIVERLTRQLAERDQGQGTDKKAGKGSKGAKKPEDDAPPAPPLILKLSGGAYDQELSALGRWVQYLLVPNYLTEVGSQHMWCDRWYEHPQAVARLHGLWLAWQELTTPEAGGYTGPSVWTRDHLDPCINALRDPAGPFAACMSTDDRPQHSVLPAPPVRPLPYIPPPVIADAGSADESP